MAEPGVASHDGEMKRLREQVRSLAMANARAADLMAELQESRELEALLKDRNRDLLAAQSLEQYRNRILELVARNEPIESIWDCLARLVTSRDDQTHLAIFAGSPETLALAYWSGSEQPPALQRLHDPNQDLVAMRVALGPGEDGQAAQPSDIGTWSSLIHSAAGQLLGAVVLVGATAAAAGIRTLLDQVVILAGIALEHRDLYQKLAHRAQHDTLTELPNRELFNERLESAIAMAQAAVAGKAGVLAILWIDLDGFKLINDTLGHRVGDLLLRQVALILKGIVRPGDTVARMGGDEFAILMPLLEPKDREAVAARVAAQLLTRLSQPLPVADHNVLVTASIGISLYPEHAREKGRLMKCADLAMYDAKTSGKNSYRLFTLAHAEGLDRRLGVEHRLRNAMTDGKFRLVYQPQCDPQGIVKGLEVLLRWHDDELGEVSPTEFIPVAESSGLIIPLGEWVLNEACRQGAAWARDGFGVRIGVNVSPQQFLRPDFSELVKRALAKSGLPPELLELELTESSIANHQEESGLQLNQIRALGVKVSIDDFGVGYSSLSRLQRLPVDTLKIDRSFIQRIESAGSADGLAMVRAIIRMAESLHLSVIAEGVETAEQLRLLKGIGCDLVQGFHFHRPMTPQDAEVLLRCRPLAAQNA